MLSAPLNPEIDNPHPLPAAAGDGAQRAVASCPEVDNPTRRSVCQFSSSSLIPESRCARSSSTELIVMAKERWHPNGLPPTLLRYSNCLLETLLTLRAAGSN